MDKQAQLSKLEFLEGQKLFVQSKKANKNVDIYDNNYSVDFIKGYQEAEKTFNSKIDEYKKRNDLKYDPNDLEDEIEFTDKLEETIWITPDNQKIWGEYDMGIRGNDHRGLLDIYDLDRDDVKSYDIIHKLGYIRVVPETKVALINTDQRVTKQQEETLKKGSFHIESYDTLEQTNNKEDRKDKKTEKSVDMER